MIHSYGLKLSGNCYNAQRRLNILESCTGYITFHDYFTTMPVDNQTQYFLNTGYNVSPEPIFNEKFAGFPYNTTQFETISFPDYYFDINDTDLWSARSWTPFPPYSQTYYGPRFDNNGVVIPLKKHPETVLSGLKQGRLEYDFLDANITSIGAELQDPLHFTGVYPFTPQDPTVEQKPAGFMFSNIQVDQPYWTREFFEDSGSDIDRSKKTTTQLNFLPFTDKLKVFDKTETQISEFDGLAFVIFFGEQNFTLPFNDPPDCDPTGDPAIPCNFQGLIPDPETLSSLANPTKQVFGIEVDIFLCSTNPDVVKSPRIGRLRYWRLNQPTVTLPLFNPQWNYFNILFEIGNNTAYQTSFKFKILPSQLQPLQTKKLVLSQLKINIGG